MGGKGFKNQAAFDRVIRGVRYAESKMAGIETNYGYILPSSSGTPSAHVEITVDELGGYYTGIFVYRNLEATSSVDEWLDFDDDPQCVVQEVNGESLVVGKRYPCEVVGIFELLDAFGEPTGEWYNGYPLAIVQLPGNQSLTVKEVDGVPTVENVTEIQVDQADRLVVTEVSPGIARIDFVTYDFGCGIDLDGDEVNLDLTDVVQDGLYWDNTLCYLGVNFGCGLTLIGDQLAVNNDDLAGVAATTAMVPSGTCAVAFDKTIDSTVEITYVTDVNISTVGGVVTIELVKQTITDRYNAALVLVDRVYGTPTEESTELDLCELTACCPCEETGSQDYTSAAGSFTFTATCTGLHTIECWGGGGNGSFHNTRANGGGGGGGGAYARSELCLEAGVEYAVVVGDKGGPGGDSTFGATLVVAKGGAAGNADGTGGAGGSAVASTGTVKFKGGNGGNGTAFPTNAGGGGGGAGGTAGAGGDGGTPTHGNGGAPEGPTVGDGGDGGTAGNNGVAAQLYGGGGGGAGGGSGTVGADATRGRVRITW